MSADEASCGMGGNRVVWCGKMSSRYSTKDNGVQWTVESNCSQKVFCVKFDTQCSIQKNSLHFTTCEVGALTTQLLEMGKQTHRRHRAT